MLPVLLVQEQTHFPTSKNSTGYFKLHALRNPGYGKKFNEEIVIEKVLA